MVGVVTNNIAEVRDAWPALSWEERAEAFRLMSRGEAEDVFFGLSLSSARAGPATAASATRTTNARIEQAFSMALS